MSKMNITEYVIIIKLYKSGSRSVLDSENTKS